MLIIFACVCMSGSCLTIEKYIDMTLNSNQLNWNVCLLFVVHGRYIKVGTPQSLQTLCIVCVFDKPNVFFSSLFSQILTSYIQYLLLWKIIFWHINNNYVGMRRWSETRKQNLANNAYSIGIMQMLTFQFTCIFKFIRQ